MNTETKKDFEEYEEQEAKKYSLYFRTVQDMVSSDEPNY